MNAVKVTTDFNYVKLRYCDKVRISLPEAVTFIVIGYNEVFAVVHLCP